MGGPVQAEEGVLGGIVGASKANFKKAEPYLKFFCKDYFYFGEVGMGAKSKLLNNFNIKNKLIRISNSLDMTKKFIDNWLKKIIETTW